MMSAVRRRASEVLNRYAAKDNTLPALDSSLDHFIIFCRSVTLYTGNADLRLEVKLRLGFYFKLK